MENVTTLERHEVPTHYPAVTAYFTVRAARRDNYAEVVEGQVQRYLYPGFVAMDAHYDEASDYDDVVVTVRYIAYYNRIGSDLRTAKSTIYIQQERLRSSGYMTCTEPLFYLPIKEA